MKICLNCEKIHADGVYHCTCDKSYLESYDGTDSGLLNAKRRATEFKHKIYSDQFVHYLYVVLVVIGLLGVLWVLAFIDNVIFGHMTLSEFNTYFPNQVGGFFGGMRSWFEKLEYKISH